MNHETPISLYFERADDASALSNFACGIMPTSIIIASDSFKGSLTSREVGEAARRGIKTAIPDARVEIVPVADGGEGTLEALSHALGARKIEAEASGPLGEGVKAQYCISGQTAIIEMSEASGLTLIPPEKRDPWLTTSFGTGELIRDALLKGCRKFLIGIGGSATNDAGVGMLSALGFRFLDSEGSPIGFGGGEVGRIRSIDDSQAMPELREASFTVACDVTNPLTGENGSSRIFGPQKGADSKMCERLDKALHSFANITKEYQGRDLSATPGTGAAGGTGFAFLSFLNATLKRGIDMVLDAVDFDRRIENASLVITGEGRLDSQTCLGKTPYGVLNRCKAHDIPVIAIGGTVDATALPSLIGTGFRAVCGVTPTGMHLSQAMKPEIASQNVEMRVSEMIKQWL